MLNFLPVGLPEDVQFSEGLGLGNGLGDQQLQFVTRFCPRQYFYDELARERFRDKGNLTVVYQKGENFQKVIQFSKFKDPIGRSGFVTRDFPLSFGKLSLNRHGVVEFADLDLGTSRLERMSSDRSAMDAEVAEATAVTADHSAAPIIFFRSRSLGRGPTCLAQAVVAALPEPDAPASQDWRMTLIF
jgi:hypothetical protein